MVRRNGGSWILLYIWISILSEQKVLSTETEDTPPYASDSIPDMECPASWTLYYGLRSRLPTGY